eukprot:gene8318-8503_t
MAKVLQAIENLTPIKATDNTIAEVKQHVRELRKNDAKQELFQSNCHPSPSPGPSAAAKPPPSISCLPTDYQAFIHTSRYARWHESKQRRETWPETVRRYLNFLAQHLKRKCNYELIQELRQELESGILHLEVMPSMRAMMTAGPALEKCNIAGYNCAYLPINHPHSFDELLYILMNGTGVGFSVEPRCVEQLPVVADCFSQSSSTLVVEDSREGWARALRELIALLYTGQIPRWDTSKLRAKGARLKTFGGRASGPEPLESLFLFCVSLFSGAKGRQLTPLEAHDLVCKVAEVVVVGGVRRSALISLSAVEDNSMRQAKAGPWWENSAQRAMANNSAVYTEKPSVGLFLAEWKSLYDSGSGERGLFSRAAAQRQAARNGRRDAAQQFGTNPCCEIILRPYQFCNLTEVVIREQDDLASLLRKVRLATLLGSFQSTLVDFPYLRGIWSHNTSEERLLGVSLTGIMDNRLMSGQQGSQALQDALQMLRSRALEVRSSCELILFGVGNAAEVNADVARELGIPQSAAVTCVKPSGTVSQLVDSASGIHPRHSQYYIRRVRCNKDDPLTKFMQDNGVPMEDCVMNPKTTAVFSFPIKAPDGALTRDDVSALSQLELCLAYQRHWCEHKPSITVTVREEEWLDVGAWVYRHFDQVSGVSFLPYDCGTYKQTPYEKVDEATYLELLAMMPPKINWSGLRELERQGGDDKCEFELACSATGGCEMVDVL